MDLIPHTSTCYGLADWMIKARQGKAAWIRLRQIDVSNVDGKNELNWSGGLDWIGLVEGR
jgi:hypothetical protein